MTTLAKQFVNEWFCGLGRGALLCRDIFSSLCKVKPVWHDILDEMYFIGVKSQSVVAITGAFTGMVLCAQTYFQFHKVKMDTATLAVVSVGMGSELGPVLTSLMVAGRVGAAIAAALGTMRVTEQIDALRTLAAHPIDYLIVRLKRKVPFIPRWMAPRTIHLTYCPRRRKARPGSPRDA